MRAQASLTVLHLLPQNEGITFGVEGTLYLASEGHHGLAVLAAYAPPPSGRTDDSAMRLPSGWSKGVQAPIVGRRHTDTATTPTRETA